MIKQAFKKHQFAFCTLIVLFGLITIYSPSYGGTYNGGPAGGICRQPVQPVPDTIPEGPQIEFRYSGEDEIDETDGYYYRIITFEHSIHISLNFRSRVSYEDVNGETHILGSEEDTEDGEVHEYFISGLQSDTEYRIGISGVLCGATIVETEPSTQSSNEDPATIEVNQPQ